MDNDLITGNAAIFSHEDGVSNQDRLMAGMSRAQIREYRQQATKQATKGRYASENNQYQRSITEAIHTGERLTNATLQKLVKQAKSSNGVDAGELLDFTLGNTVKNRALSRHAGLKNSLTAATLGLYVANVQKAAKSFVGGISPRQVINQSRFVDIKRANEQIHLATIFKRDGDTLYFLTNSGPESKDPNHKVTVQLLDYPAMMVGRTQVPSTAELKNMLEHGKVKFDCDCGRHQYWYRYIATVGRFNFGAHENRYPSTRNPNLTGVGCKHVLRVMHHLMSTYGQQKVKGYIKSDLAKGTGRQLSERVRNEQVKREAQYQTDPRKAEHWRRQIEKKIKAELKRVSSQMTPMPSAQQYQVMRQMQAVGIKFSPEQQRQFEAFSQNQVPFRGGK